MPEATGRIEMSDMTLAAVVTAAAEKFAIPGVAAAAWADGAETYACHGVTSWKTRGRSTSTRCTHWARSPRPSPPRR
jgi:hypothetical protein